MSLQIIDGTGAPQTLKTAVSGGQHTTYHRSEIEVNGQVVDGTVKLPTSGDWVTNTQMRATPLDVKLTSTTATESLGVVGPMTVDEFTAAYPTLIGSLVKKNDLDSTQGGAITVNVTGPLTRTQLDAAAVATIENFYSVSTPVGQPWNQAWTFNRSAAGGSANTVDTTKTVQHERQWNGTTFYQKWRFNSSGQLLSTSVWGTNPAVL